MTTYQCKCGWCGTEYDLRTVCMFNETRYEPAEYEGYCPDCGGNWEDMIEITQEHTS